MSFILEFEKVAGKFDISAARKAFGNRVEKNVGLMEKLHGKEYVQKWTLPNIQRAAEGSKTLRGPAGNPFKRQDALDTIHGWKQSHGVLGQRNLGMKPETLTKKLKETKE